LELPSVELSMHLRSMELPSVELSVTTCFFFSAAVGAWCGLASAARWAAEGIPRHGLASAARWAAEGIPLGAVTSAGMMYYPSVELPSVELPSVEGGSEARPVEAARRVTILATIRVRAIIALPTALCRARLGGETKDLCDGHTSEEETPSQE
jgi:hypothetical protein